jgi:tetratricopeptide (TPR) repeat protein
MLGHALDRHAWDDAEKIVMALDYYWDARGYREEAAAWADRILHATAEHGQMPSETTGSLWVSTTVSQADRQRLARKLDEAERSYQQALAYLQALPGTKSNRARISGIYHKLGVTANDRGQLEKADDWYQKAIQIREELGLRHQLADDYLEVAITAQTRGALDKAEEWSRKSLAIHTELGDRFNMAVAYHQLGIIAFDRWRLDEADEWHRRAAQIREELGLRVPLAASYHELSLTAEAQGRLDEAEDWCRKSLAIKEKLGHRPGMAITYHQLGRIAHIRGQLDEAEDWSRKSLAIHTELGDRTNMAVAYLQLGITAEERGQDALALERYIRCVTLFDQFPSSLTRTAPTALARLAHHLGMPALEQSWREVTGQPAPQVVYDYIASHHDEAQRGDKS